MQVRIGRAYGIVVAFAVLQAFGSPSRAAELSPQSGWPTLNPTQTLAPTQQETFPAPSEPPTTLYFGAALAIHGAIALVGMPGYPSLGAHGGPNAEGAVAIFRLQSGSWVRSGTLQSSTPTPDDFFGEGVAFRHDTAVVQGQSGLHVFRHTQSGWSEVQQLPLPSQAEFSGGGVEVGERTIFAGDVTFGRPGAVYVFEPDEKGVWRQVDTLSSGEGVNSDFFGNSIAVSRSDTLIIGAPGDGQGGAVYIFRRRGQHWIKTQKLIANDVQQGAGFGTAVALSHERIAIGAPSADPGPACGPPNEGGAVYVFVPVHDSWQQVDKITTPVPGCTANFGSTVAIGRHVLVGATPSEFPFEQGGTYVYGRQGSSYTPSAASSDVTFSSLPILGLSGCTLLTGLPFDRGFSTGFVEVFDVCSSSSSSGASSASSASSDTGDE